MKKKIDIPVGAKVTFDHFVDMFKDGIVDPLVIEEVTIKDDTEEAGEFVPSTDWDSEDMKEAAGVVGNSIDRVGRIMKAKKIKDERTKTSTGGGGSALYQYNPKTGLVEKRVAVKSAVAKKQDYPF